MLPLVINVFIPVPITINHSPGVSRLGILCALFWLLSVDVTTGIATEAGPAGRRQEFRRAIP
jgi:hypothetical protein